MPYHLEKSGGGYVVVNSDTGKRHSNKPLPRSRAVAQMRLLYGVENGTTAKAANYGARAGETIIGRLVRGANGRFGSGDASSVQADANATIAQNRAANAAAGALRAKPGKKPRKGRAGARRAKPKAPKKAKAPKKGRRLSLSGQRRRLARQQANHATVAKALGLQEDAAGALLDLAQGKSVPDDGGLEKMGLAKANADGTYSLTAPGMILAKAADLGNVKLAQDVMQAIAATKAAIVTTAPDGHPDSVMVAFYVPGVVADVLVSATDSVRGVHAEPAKTLHCTLMMLGSTDDLADNKYQVLAGVERYARWAAPVIGTIGGTGRFAHVQEDGTNSLYASVDAPDLAAWRDNLIQVMADTSGMLPAADHGFQPHITLSYIPADGRTPTVNVPQMTILFATVSVAWGDERYDFPLGQSSPMVFKDTSGRLRWITVSSSAFRDRDNQIVSTKALTADVERADADRVYGPLRWWHQPGIDLGTCDFNAMAGRLLIESGTFFNEDIGEKVKAAAPNLQVSIGFLHPAIEPDADGVFSTIKRFERSLLPAGYASNLYTQLVVEGDQPMDETKKAAARALFGDDLLNKILTAAESTEKAADLSGVAFKAGQPASQPAVAAKPAAAAAAAPVADQPADTADAADADADYAIGDMSTDEFTAVLKAANQPMVDVLTALVNAFTGTAQQTATATATKDAAVETRLTAAEQEVATLKAKLTAAEATVAELNGSLPASIASRRASQTGPIVPDATVKAIASRIAPDNGFIGFLTGDKPQQGA